MLDRLVRERDTMPLGQVIKSAAFATKLLGYGNRQGPPPGAAPVHVQFNAVDPAVLAAARERIRQLDRLPELEEAPTATPVAVREENPVKVS